jgi:predicted adenylyl cyclase CyaB
MGRQYVARNIEIKARVSHPATLRERILALSTSGPELLIQRDTFFRVPRGRLKLRESGHGDAELIYYERRDQAGPKLSTYSRTPLTDPVLMHEILDWSLGAIGVVAKRRELFLASKTRIHLDEVEGLGFFVELEVVLTEGQSLDDGKGTSNLLMRRLNIGADELIDDAYIDLLRANARR